MMNNTETPVPAPATLVLCDWSAIAPSGYIYKECDDHTAKNNGNYFGGHSLCRYHQDVWRIIFGGWGTE